MGTSEFGFDEGGVYSLKQFQEKANNFKKEYFGGKKPLTEDDVEREFWRLVESLTETVEVEYGADIHSTAYGSGFPTVERHPREPYATNPWNLNVLPFYGESLFRHIKTDITGMTVPWVYIGMCFSTFCWHNEDHYAYSANYQHFGDTKTWYGVPGAEAEKFEKAMRQALPELFEGQPDLLLQLVTMMRPDVLQKAGVNVYAIDQRAEQFVITFPQAYHAGFNHGFNFNEAVNFAPADWEPYGAASIGRLRTFRKQPCFSHDELLIMAARHDNTISTAKWLAPALERASNHELAERRAFISRHESISPHKCNLNEEGNSTLRNNNCPLKLVIEESNVPENGYQCDYCKVYCYLTHFRCHETGKNVCLAHAGSYDCCDKSLEERLLGNNHTLRYGVSDQELKTLTHKVKERAKILEVA